MWIDVKCPDMNRSYNDKQPAGVYFERSLKIGQSHSQPWSHIHIDSSAQLLVEVVSIKVC